jgi:hypothetical protein
LTKPAADLEGTPSAPSVSTPSGAIVLSNDFLSLAALPRRGGKIISLRSRRDNLEWLLPPLRPYAEARSDRGFELGDGGGWDECLPSVSPSAGVPDHGDIWRRPWQSTRHGDQLDMSAEASSLPLLFRRRITLAGSTIRLDYQVENIGDAPADFLYSAHPLLQVQEGDRILLPQQVRRLKIEFSAAGRLGAPGEHCAWPLARDRQGREVDLSRVGPPDGQTAEKLFAGPLRNPWCGLYRPQHRQGMVFRVDSPLLPYLGLWICHAAWPDSGPARQYTVAIEPTNANCDGLADARAAQTATPLAPGQTVRWTMEIGIVGENGGVDLETFRAAAEMAG